MPHHGLPWNLYNETGVHEKEKRSCFQPCQEQFFSFGRFISKSSPRKNPELAGLVSSLNGQK
jgi:hypothetical protein